MAEPTLVKVEFEEVPDILDTAALGRLRAALAPGEDIVQHIAPASNPDEIGLPKIQGHQLTLREMDAFIAYVETGTLTEAAERSGVSTSTLQRYRREAWWQELFDLFVREKQQDFHAGLMRLTEDALGAAKRIVSGTLNIENEAKYANAMMNMIQLLTKVGKSPLQDNRTVTNIDNRALINTGTVHINREKLADMGQDELLRLITGQVKLE